jgi:hypothetical protein
MTPTVPPDDMKALVEEAQRTAYDPRARRCWPWSHQWTMWRPVRVLQVFQQRRCVRCGITKERWV